MYVMLLQAFLPMSNGNACTQRINPILVGSRVTVICRRSLLQYESALIFPDSLLCGGPGSVVRSRVGCLEADQNICDTRITIGEVQEVFQTYLDISCLVPL